MKMQVIRCDGRTETLTLRAGAWRSVDGVLLDRLTDGGCEHFFTKDGRYDGWGGSVACATAKESTEVIAVMEEKREISGTGS